MSHSRLVSELKWAKAAQKPHWVSEKAPKGAKARGLSYEKALSEALPMARRGLWWAFGDSQGLGWCQTDVLLLLPDGDLLVLEAKLTLKQAAFSQISRLYIPVIEKATSRRCFGAVVCKNLAKIWLKPAICDNLSDLVTLCRYSVPVLHWLGRSPLVPQGQSHVQTAVRALPSEEAGRYTAL